MCIIPTHFLETPLDGHALFMYILKRQTTRKQKMQTQPKFQYPLPSEKDIREQAYQKIWINSHYTLLGSSESELYSVEGK